MNCHSLMILKKISKMEMINATSSRNCPANSHIKNVTKTFNTSWNNTHIIVSFATLSKIVCIPKGFFFKYFKAKEAIYASKIKRRTWKMNKMISSIFIFKFGTNVAICTIATYISEQKNKKITQISRNYNAIRNWQLFITPKQIYSKTYLFSYFTTLRKPKYNSGTYKYK